ncbi:flavin reductase family protein [Spirosoma endbachense]|uniref:Flavin reductase n=1 Tax=Spirosoma endbachense TaxID=2666025 RepID=A0A6P1W1L4_9BACT|nr:flavin reductase family protein [Spirosoma endbachense]QHV98488.1 flavin reductase [Spirosoma endbachense]
MLKRLLKYKNYDVHSITTMAGIGTTDQRYNANIVTWLMQTDMKMKVLAIALYKVDYTIELVRESGILNVNLLATNQSRLIRKLGQQSGRTENGIYKNKFKNVPYALDERGCPYLTEAIGYVQCRVLHNTDAGDHELFICAVQKQVVLNPEKEVMTYAFLKAHKLIRG